MRRIIPNATMLTVIVATVAVMTVAGGLPAVAAASGGDVWLISTRRVPVCGCTGIEDARFDYWHLADDDWVDADRELFHACDDPAVPTVFYIHGNRAGTHTAIQEGWSVHRHLDQQADGRPFRLVVWSWPAERACRRIRDDVRLKARRSDLQAYYLAQCIDRIKPTVPLSAVGYSFGARIITGALHILAGGEVAGRSLSQRCLSQRSVDERVPIRAVLVAAALDYDWLLPGRRHGLAVQGLDQMLVTRNPCDRVLKWYPRMYGRRGPEALGYTGPACLGMLGDDAEKIEVLSVTCSVGKGHSWTSYLCAPSLYRRLGWYAFLEPAEAAEGN